MQGFLNTSKGKKERIELILIPQTVLESIPEDKSLWYESPEEKEEKVLESERRIEQLQLVQRSLLNQLTLKERRYIKLHFFEGITIYKISKNDKTNPATIFRSIRRAVRKLKSIVNGSYKGKRKRMGKLISTSYPRKNSHKRCNTSSSVVSISHPDP